MRPTLVGSSYSSSSRSHQRSSHKALSAHAEWALLLLDDDEKEELSFLLRLAIGVWFEGDLLYALEFSCHNE